MEEERTISEFDSFAEEYEALHAENIKASGYSVSYFAEYKIKEIATHLHTIGVINREINFLNFGCGIGNSEAFIRKYLPNSTIYSVDLSSKSIDYARERHKDLTNIHFGVTDGRTIPFNLPFDAILISNVLHHTPRPQQLIVLRMLYHALNTSGSLYLFEHNPFNPLTVRAVRACPFDKGVVLLSPLYARKLLSQAYFTKVSLNFALFFPKCLERLNPLQRHLRKIPLGAQYYLVANKGS